MTVALPSMMKRYLHAGIFESLMSSAVHQART